MPSYFKNIGLAITFSPTGNALLMEAKRLREQFDAKLTLIHVGDKTDTAKARLNETIEKAGLDQENLKLIWTGGTPASAILRSSKKENIDLLIAGALEKEKPLKYYIGSVARRIMREAQSSVLILPRPQLIPKTYKKIFVTTDYSAQSEKTIKIAYELAKMNDAEDLKVIREFQVMGFAIAESYGDAERNKLKWTAEEEAKLKMYLHELCLTEVPVSTEALYGKQGWMANRYAKEHNADLLVITAPLIRSRFFDRLFTHDFEFIIKELPSPLLIIKH